MYLTASNSWAKPWPILKLVTIYKSTWVILLTGFGRKVIFEKNMSCCISPPPLNTCLYSPTLQTPHSWHSKSCPRTFLFCTDTPPQRPWGHTTLAPRPVPQGLCPSEPFSTQKWFLSAWYCTAIGPGAISLEPALSHGPARTLLLSLCLRNQQGKWENPDKQKPSSSTKSRLRKTQRTEQRSLKADF